MSKLLKLKEWLTLADAVQYLTTIFQEEVTKADLLRFALDGHSKLSVNFIYPEDAKAGWIVPWEETEWLVGSPLIALLLHK